ncbi:transcription antitermination factor NusB [Vulgatibacter incomptus]|uniref:transcription antitermination factor NusB n=1 Tax=Vulgatibacter incomptus TaxID=1391653 RepID=UPI000682D072
MQQRHVGRERAVQALFSLENATPAELPQGLAHFWATVDEPTSAAASSFAEELIRGVIENRASLDAAIQAQSESWRVERMAKVDRNVLRLGAFELLHTDTPGRVVINEAVEIARTFGAEGSPAFVNGILDKVARVAGRL